MDNSKKTLKYLCIGLAAAVMVLLVVVAFLLGQRSAVKKGTDEKQQSASSAMDAPRNLEISMAAGDLDIVQGDAFHVQYDDSVVRVTTNGDSMTIETTPRHPTASERRRMNVTVTLPETCTFGDVEIEMGAGEMKANTLRAGTMDLKLGAGNVTLNDLFVSEAAKIQGGAGEFTVKDGEISNLTMECAAGEANVSAKLIGTSRINSAIGRVDLDLKGSQADYTVSFGMGLGECYYNNDKLSGNGTFGEGENRVTVNGGLGIIYVNVG